MPCDQLRETSLDFGKANVGFLAKAMTELGWKVQQQHEHGFTATKGGVTTSFNRGTFTTSGGYGAQTNLNEVEIRKEYQRQNVTYAAQRAGAVLKWTNAERTEFQIIKRGL